MFAEFQKAFLKEGIGSNQGQLWADILRQINEIQPTEKPFKEPKLKVIEKNLKHIKEISDDKDDDKVNIKDNIKYEINWEYFQYHIWLLVKNDYFDYTMIIIIIINLLIMMGSVETWSPLYESTLDVLSAVCTCIFILEAILKLLGYGLEEYFKHGWNKFDFVVAVLGILDLIMIGVNSTEVMGIFKSFQVMRIFRMARVIR